MSFPKLPLLKDYGNRWHNTSVVKKEGGGLQYVDGMDEIMIIILSTVDGSQLPQKGSYSIHADTEFRFDSLYPEERLEKDLCTNDCLLVRQFVGFKRPGTELIDELGSPFQTDCLY